MHYLKKILKFHKSLIRNTYRKLLLKTDKKVFCVLFNFKSFISKSSAHVSWKTDSFEVSDNFYPNIFYQFRHQRQGNMAYESGFKKRADDLADDYFLKKIDFKNGDVFYDCGANTGDIMLWFNINNIDIEYIGFEPSPIEFILLKQNIFPKKAHNVGLYNKKGELKFYLSSQNADSSLIKPKKYDDVINIKTKRLEDLINCNIKCLKVEAEGAEPEVLEGIGDKFKFIEYISADLGFERGEKSESTLIQSTNYLLGKGFELVDISHTRVCALFHNTLFTNPS